MVCLFLLCFQLENVLQFIEDNSSSLAQKDYDQAYKVWSGFDIVVRLKSVGLGPEDFKENKVLKYLNCLPFKVVILPSQS